MNSSQIWRSGNFQIFGEYFQVAEKKDDGIGHFFESQRVELVKLETTGVQVNICDVDFRFKEQFLHYFMSICLHATSNIVFMKMESNVSFSFHAGDIFSFNIPIFKFNSRAICHHLAVYFWLVVVWELVGTIVVLFLCRQGRNVNVEAFTLEDLIVMVSCEGGPCCSV